MTEQKEKSGREDNTSRDEFEVIIAVPESRKLELGLPADKVKELIELLDSLKWDRKTLQRYVNHALRLRKLEKEYHKTYSMLVKDYEKITKEEVKTRYAIEQLLEKRKKLEEDLKLYMEQYNMTLETVRKTVYILEELKKNGLGIEDLQRATKLLSYLKDQGYDVSRIVSQVSQYENFSQELEKLKRELIEAKESLEKISQERETLDMLLREEYGLVDGLRNLKNDIEKLSIERDIVQSELSKYSEEVDSLKKEIEELTNMKFDLREINLLLQEKKRESEELGKKVEELKNELAELIGVEASIKEILTKQKELLEKVEVLEKEIKNKESIIDLLDGEMVAAYSVLKLLQDPEGGTVEDLEQLSQYIQKLVKVKKGEALAQKPLEPYLLDRVRKTLIDLVMPYLKKDFVPRWVFERVEKELKLLSEKRIALEEEIASLRRSIEERSRVEAVKPEHEKKVEIQSDLVAVSQDGVTSGLKSISEGRKARITCIYCREASIIALPSEAELEELSSQNMKLRFRCGKCGKTYDLQPDIILRKVRGE
ncbi:MAG: hypothetical protein QXF28_03585 [Nitrososphaerota archaeon]